MTTLNLNIFSAAEKKIIRHHNDFWRKMKVKKTEKQTKKEKLGKQFQADFQMELCNAIQCKLKYLSVYSSRSWNARLLSAWQQTNYAIQIFTLRCAVLKCMQKCSCTFYLLPCCFSGCCFSSNALFSSHPFTQSLAYTFSRSLFRPGLC